MLEYITQGYRKEGSENCSLDRCEDRELNVAWLFCGYKKKGSDVCIFTVVDTKGTQEEIYCTDEIQGYRIQKESFRWF